MNSTIGYFKLPKLCLFSILQEGINVPEQLGLNEYRGTPLSIMECGALEDLERILRRPIPKVTKVGCLVKAAKFGFVEHNGHVTQLGLSQFGQPLLDGIPLPESFSNLNSLQVLCLSDNYLTSLPEVLGQFSSLHTLWLNDNQLTSLPKTIGKLISLQKLVLNYNQLTSLPEMIGNLQSLRELSLLGNQLGFLPETFGQLSSLTKLNLNRNQVTHLPATIGNLESLKVLDLGCNKITTLPETIGNLRLLQELHLYGNELTSLPETLGNLTSLKILDLCDNKLTSIPESLEQLPSLKFLDLHACGLISLPETIKMWIINLKKRKCEVKTPHGEELVDEFYYQNREKLEEIAENVNMHESYPIANDEHSWEYLKLSILPENGVQVKTSVGLATLRMKKLGKLQLTSGWIVAGDPGYGGVLHQPPFAHQVPPGQYEVWVNVATFSSDNDQRVAFGILKLVDEPPTRWEIATLKDKEKKAGEHPEAHGYGVDSGLGCFLDRDAVFLMEDKWERLEEKLGEHEVPTWDWVDLLLDKKRHLNVITFSSGDGDGCYPSFWGFGQSGQRVALVPDFYTIMP